jgi:hypothetical protein
MLYELTDYERGVISPMLPNKPSHLSGFGYRMSARALRTGLTPPPSWRRDARDG